MTANKNFIPAYAGNANRFNEGPTDVEGYVEELRGQAQFGGGVVHLAAVMEFMDRVHAMGPGQVADLVRTGIDEGRFTLDDKTRELRFEQQ